MRVNITAKASPPFSFCSNIIFKKKPMVQNDNDTRFRKEKELELNEELHQVKKSSDIRFFKKKTKT